MTGITLAVAQEKLDGWLAAEDKLMAGQSYSINGRTLTRVNLAEVRDAIDSWDRRVKRLTRGGIRISHGVPS